jgi:hypothetical protein
MNDNVSQPTSSGSRAVLEHRRHAEAFSFVHNEIEYHATFTRFGAPLEGPIAEMFITGAKTGSAVQYAIWEAAIAASLALQYGCPPEILARALPKLEDGSPAGVLCRFFSELGQSR